MFEEQRKSYEVQLRKLKEELRAELKEKEGLRAELKEKEGLRAELKEKEGLRAELKEKEGLRAELKEKEGLRAELKEKEGLRAEKVEVVTEEHLIMVTPSMQDTIKMEDSHGDLNCSKPYLPLMENSQLIESFEDPVKEEREEIHLDMTPRKAGRGGRKRKASPAAAIDSVSKVCPPGGVVGGDLLPFQQESPVKRQRSSRRKQLPTTALVGHVM